MQQLPTTKNVRLDIRFSTVNLHKKIFKQFLKNQKLKGDFGEKRFGKCLLFCKLLYL